MSKGGKGKEREKREKKSSLCFKHRIEGGAVNIKWFRKGLPGFSGKTFPGELTVKVPESSDLEDKNSQGYQDFHNYVVNFVSVSPLSHLRSSSLLTWVCRGGGWGWGGTGLHAATGHSRLLLTK